MNERKTTRQLKARLSAIVRRVEAGETVTITRHGKAVARIVPVQAKLEDRMAALE